jgi:hypothetical protein
VVVAGGAAAAVDTIDVVVEEGILLDNAVVWLGV